MRIVSWNVAGIRAVLKKGFQSFFSDVNADVFCIQEVKALESQIEFVPEGYYCYYNPAFRLGYSGTIVFTKEKPLSVVYGMNEFINDDEGRLITVEYEDFYLINTYVPNVKRDLSRMDYRMKWEDMFLLYIKKLELNKPVIVCGDFNVAHEEIDIKNAKSNIGNAGFTYEEREKFDVLLKNGFIDTFRYLNPNSPNHYTWWSYMSGVRERNIGWRIDYFIISDALKDNLTDAVIYKDIYGSDHCPIGIEIDYHK